MCGDVFARVCVFCKSFGLLVCVFVILYVCWSVYVRVFAFVQVLMYVTVCSCVYAFVCLGVAV